MSHFKTLACAKSELNVHALMAPYAEVCDDSISHFVNPEGRWDYFTFESCDPWGSQLSTSQLAALLILNNSDDALPFALVGPDSWHEWGPIGAIDMYSGKKSDSAWRTEALAFCRSHPDQTLWVLDCHI